MSVQQQRRPVPVTTRTGTGALLQVGYRYKIDLLPYDPTSTSLREPAQQMRRARGKN